MRTKISALGLVCLFTLGCGFPTATLTNLYPQSPNFLYSQMLLTLQDLKFTIEETDELALSIVAKKVTSAEASRAAIAGEEEVPLFAMIKFQKNNGQTAVLVKVVQPGFIKVNIACKMWANDILEKLEERIKK